jgi:signal transduction histidine kinase
LFTVRFKIALTIFLTGLLTSIGVVATVVYAFERFEHEATYYRATAFLERVVTRHPDIFALQERFEVDFNGFLGNLVLLEANTQLYLLDPRGAVVASSVDLALPPNFRVAMGPVMDAAGPMPMPFVIGDDPENMGGPAVVAARPVFKSIIRKQTQPDGYLYVVCHKDPLKRDNLAAIQNSFAGPALVLILAIVAMTTLLAAWVTAAVTQPLKRLTDSVAEVTRTGLQAGATLADQNGNATIDLAPNASRDEIGQLTAGIRAMLHTVHTQWSMLRRLDHFRREGVSNLSHDLRSPLTATAACLETLDAQWSHDPVRLQDRQLLEVALRNTRNAARLVKSLGDLAQLDEPTFKLRAEVMDLVELLDDVALRFTERARRQGVTLKVDGADRVFAAVDVELFERAISNLVDNALTACRVNDTVSLSAAGNPTTGMVRVQVTDTGPGIAAQDLPLLFDRFYQSRQSTAPAMGEGGKGLGLAIVKRIAEMHGGGVTVEAMPVGGVCVTLTMPIAQSHAA